MRLSHQELSFLCPWVQVEHIKHYKYCIYHMPTTFTFVIKCCPSTPATDVTESTGWSAAPAEKGSVLFLVLVPDRGLVRAVVPGFHPQRQAKKADLFWTHYLREAVAFALWGAGAGADAVARADSPAVHDDVDEDAVDSDSGVGAADDSRMGMDQT